MARQSDPRDPIFFASRHVEKLRRCVHDLSWLLSRGYPAPSALRFVAEVHQLSKRQRMAVMRSSCSDSSVAKRRVGMTQKPTGMVYIDTLNLVILLERAWGGGLILRGRDRCLRDIAGVHGSYRLQEETQFLIQCCLTHMAQFSDIQVHWLIDAPVSNSGQLLQLIQQCGGQARRVHDVDQEMIQSQGCTITSDVVILDAASQWYPLADLVIQEHISKAWILDIGTGTN